MSGATQAPAAPVGTGKVAGRRELRFEPLDEVLAEVERLAAAEPVPLDEGLERMRRALGRLKAEAPTAPNVIFGPLSHDEWVALHCRHAELHLGFLVPE